MTESFLDILPFADFSVKMGGKEVASLIRYSSSTTGVKRMRFDFVH